MSDEILLKSHEELQREDAERKASETELEKKEEEEVEERRAPSSDIVYHAILREGEEEMERTTSALFWSGLAAGLAMGFSLVAEGLLRARLPEAEWTPLVSRFGYSVGFLLIVLGRQQLFTENTLTVILPLLREMRQERFRSAARVWIIVLLANLVGAALFAFVLGRTQLFEPKVLETFLRIGREAMNHPFLVLLLRAIFAGWLIALMVWLLPFAESARVTVIIIVTYVVGLAGFTHVIAGSVETMLLCVVGERSWSDYFFHFLGPAFIGNSIGGVSLVAALNHAQVNSGESS